MANHRIANVRGRRGEIWFIECASQEGSRRHKNVLCLRACLHTQKQYRNRQVRKNSPHVCYLPVRGSGRTSSRRTHWDTELEDEREEYTAGTHPNLRAAKLSSRSVSANYSC